MNYCILLCTISSTMAFMKPSVLDIVWFRKRSYSCIFVNGKTFANVLSLSVFCAMLWLFCWKLRMHVHCRSRGKEVDCNCLFHCLLLIIIFHHWDVERGQQLMWVDYNVNSCNRNWLWCWMMWWLRAQCLGYEEE